MIRKKILVVGHPRTGTGYTSKLLQSFGLNVLHEKMGNDGISAWQWVLRQNENLPYMNPDIRKNEYVFDNIIYCVRNPKYSIQSIHFTEFDSFKYRKSLLKSYKNQLEADILSILTFNDIIKKDFKPSIIYRVEDQEKYLAEKLGVDINGNVSKTYNTRINMYRNKSIDYKNVSANIKLKVNEYCDEYGYDRLFVL